MEKKNLKAAPLKKASFYNRNSHLPGFDDPDAEIRMGICLANEKVKKESIKRRIEAPLSTEEQIFLSK